jgi:hypothetical protein
MENLIRSEKLKKIEGKYALLKKQSAVDPQVNDGYVRINNEILESLLPVHFFNEASAQLVLMVIRSTWGWNKKWDILEINQIRQYLDIDFNTLKECITECEDRNIILSSFLDDGIVCLMFNKHYDTWVTDNVGDNLKINKEDVSVEKIGTPKRKYAESVYLTDEQYKELVNKFGEKTAKENIEELSLGILSKGYKYKSHYHAILNWKRREEKEKNTPVMPKKRFEPGVPDNYESRLKAHIDKVHKGQGE